MKFVKMSIFALTLGLFATSCGNSGNAEGEKKDTAAAQPAPAAAPAPAPAADTAKKMDTAKAAPAAAPAPEKK